MANDVTDGSGALRQEVHTVSSRPPTPYPTPVVPRPAPSEKVDTATQTDASPPEADGGVFVLDAACEYVCPRVDSRRIPAFFDI